MYLYKLQLEHPFVQRLSIAPVRMLTKDSGWNLAPGTNCLLTGFGEKEASAYQTGEKGFFKV